MIDTVVAVYDNYSDAQRAADALIDAGFSRNGTTLHTHQDSGSRHDETAGLVEGTSVTQHQTSGDAGIGNFFKALFGSEDDKRYHDEYAESVRRGGYVVTAHADSEAQSDYAVEIMNRFHPFDIEERSQEWKAAGWSGYDETAPRMSAEDMAQERTASARRQPAEASDASHGAKAPEQISNGNRLKRSGSVRIFRHALVIADTGGADLKHHDADSDFRSHWQTSYANEGGRYDDYDDAYRYGSRVAGSSRYQNRHWDDMEPDLRADWESSHPASAWEKIREAVRYGAERIAGKRHSP